MNKTVYINGVINEGALKNFIAQVISIDLQDNEALDIVIDSVGGYVHEGEAIAAYINAMSKERPVRAVAKNFVASIASIIYLSAPNRSIFRNASIMIHNPFTTVEGDASELESYADELRKKEKDLAKYYSRFTKLSEADALEFMKHETTFTSTEAVKFGFAQNIIDELNNELTTNKKAVAIMKKGSFKSFLNSLYPAKTEDTVNAEDVVTEAKLEKQYYNLSYEVEGTDFFIDYEGEPEGSVNANAYYGDDVAPDGVYETEVGAFTVAGGVVTEFVPLEEEVAEGEDVEEEAKAEEVVSEDKEDEKMLALESKVQQLEALVNELANKLEATSAAYEEEKATTAKALAELKQGRRRSTKFTPAKQLAEVNAEAPSVKDDALSNFMKFKNLTTNK